MKKRILSLLTSALLLLCAVQPTLAIDTVSYKGAEVSSEITTNGESVMRRSFSRSYTKNLILAEPVVIVEDPNWDINNDSSVSVTFKSSEGPERCIIGIYYKADNASEWTLGTTEYVNLGDSTSCNIPEDYTFRVVAVSVQGSDGNATFQVTLS